MKCLLSNADRLELIDEVVTIAGLASEVISKIYQSPSTIVVDVKDDQSPVTQADRQANDIICRGLTALTPHWPILSEETALPDFSIRSQWPVYWLVDPLDGTHEFIERTGEFTINIALIEHGVPTLGVVYLPLLRQAFCGVIGHGAWLDDHIGVMPLRAQNDATDDRIRVASSRRNQGDAFNDCMSKLEQYFSQVEQIKAGSALKFCWLAQGKADIYPRFWPCCEWDTGAGQAVLEAAGGQLVDVAFRSLEYNQSQSIINPHFYALGALPVDWRALLND